MNFNELNKWKNENVITRPISLRNKADADIIQELERRKDKYNTPYSFTLRRWVRLGYEADMRGEDE